MKTIEAHSALMLERGPWDYVDDSFAARIPFDSPHESEDLLSRMVREETATKHSIVVGGERVGVLVTRVDTGTLGRELVVMAAFAKGESPLSDRLAGAIERLAAAEGCSVVRIHTIRAALAKRACEIHGYHISEIVLRRSLNSKS